MLGRARSTTLRERIGDGGRRRLMKVMVAMSGGVDSSVAAALLARERPRGRRRDDAAVGRRERHRLLQRRPTSTTPAGAPTQLGVEHLVFNFSDDFNTPRGRSVRRGARRRRRTPNPCIECNRQVKFARLAERADLLGFDAVATGHHARIGRTDGGAAAARAWRRPGQGPELRRAHARPGRPRPHGVPGRRLRQVRGPRASPPSSGCAPPTSPTARTCASSRRPAGGPSSSAAASRSTPAHVVDTAGTVGRRRCRRSSWSPSASAAASACRAAGRSASSCRSTGRRPPWSWATRPSCSTTRSPSSTVTWVGGPVDGERARADERPRRAAAAPSWSVAPTAGSTSCWPAPQRRVAVGQSVVLYDRHRPYVLGGGIAT